MTTVRGEIKSELGKQLQNYRTDRPDEWTMDEFTREAEKMQARIVELEAAIRKIHNIVGAQSEQGACWDDEVAFEHSEAVLKVFEISKQALKDNS